MINFRNVSESVPVPTDVALKFVPFGAPEPTIVFISDTKVGWIEGCDTIQFVTMWFTFNKKVTAWEVRANSTGPHDGNRVASWVSSGETVTHGEIEINADDLLQGGNEIVVYGFTPSGGWSPHPLV